MPNEQIVNYIRTQLQSGVALESVKISLLQSGWKQQDVDVAIWQAQQPVAPVIPAQPVVIQPQAVQTPTVQQTKPEQAVPEQIPTPQVPSELKAFVESKLNAGLSKISVAASLKIAGWDESMINVALGMVNESGIPKDAPSNLDVPTPKKKEVVKEEQKKSVTIIDYKIDITENFILAINIFKENFLTIVGVQIIPTILSTVATSLLSVIGLSGNVATTIIAAILGLIFMVILSVWAQSALLYAVSNRERNVLKCYGSSFKRTFPLLITFISLAGVMISGTVLFVIPAMIFSIWFVFAPFITVSEDLKGAKALARSRNYVKGNFWTIFARGFLIGIISIILLLILNTITNLLFPEPSTLKSLWNLLGSIVQLLIITFDLVFMYALFESIKNTKKDLQDSKKSFVWVIRIVSWLGCAGVISIFGLGVFLIGSALWTVFQELSATGDISMENLQEILQGLNNLQIAN